MLAKSHCGGAARRSRDSIRPLLDFLDGDRLVVSEHGMTRIEPKSRRADECAFAGKATEMPCESFWSDHFNFVKEFAERRVAVAHHGPRDVKGFPCNRLGAHGVRNTALSVLVCYSSFPVFIYSEAA
jgi:hypothetical protein